MTRSISNQLLNSITHGVVCIIYVTKRRKLVESFNQHRKDLSDVRTMRYQAKHDSLYVANDMYAENVLMEIEWLESVKNALSESTIKPWSKYHSDIGRSSVDIPGKHAILPLVDAPVHTLQTQLHCMKYIKKTVDLLNPGQTAVDSVTSLCMLLLKRSNGVILKNLEVPRTFPYLGGYTLKKYCL